MLSMSVSGPRPATQDMLGHYLGAARFERLQISNEIKPPGRTTMTNPGDFREAIAALAVLGGSAFTVEQYIRFKLWPQSGRNERDG